MGSEQGLSKGTEIDVFRVISRYNPYDDSKRINYKVKIGKLEILHTENDSAIGRIKTTNLGENDPVFDIDSFMIGDHVAVSVTN